MQSGGSGRGAGRSTTLRTLLTVHTARATPERESPPPSMRTRGVWEADAPDGYVALVVHTAAGRRLLRIEIASDVYSDKWVPWLERWLRHWDCGIRIVR